MTSECMAQWAAAFVTVAAVVVALFRTEIRRVWHRPELVAMFRRSPPDCHLTRMDFYSEGSRAGSDPAYFFRIWVENRGAEPAEHVQVFAESLQREQADGQFRVVPEFMPMNLVWTHTAGEVYAPRISPWMGRNCELGHFREHGSGRFVLLVEVAPNTGSHVLEPGTYRLALTIAASNARPRHLVLEIAFDGRWRDDEATMLREGVRIQVIGR